MPDFSQFIFVDVEFNPGTGTVREYGWEFQGRKGKSSSPERLRGLIPQANFVAGHNILRHDRPILAEKAGIDFAGKNTLDTLMLSSLLYPREPYHHLRKEYLHDEDGPSDPAQDAALCRTLFEDCLAKWETYPPELRILLGQFLKNEPGFAPFFSLAHLADEAALQGKRDAIQSWFWRNYKNSLCLKQDFEKEWTTYRAEWSFLLTLFFEEGPSDFVPFWVRYQYPHLEEILHKRRLCSCGDPGCPYCGNFLDPEKQLFKWFGYPEFRRFEDDKEVPLQKQVVEASLREESLLAIFPTGGGKSLAFQLPALIAGTQTGALTVVISPLQALMKDQVDVLNKRFGIGCAAFVNSLLTPLERKDTLEAVWNGQKDLLYIAPESLRSNTIFHLLKHRRIARFVVDEAHCFSSWGHDFRVDYLYIADFLKELQTEKNLETPIPVSSFTATARPSVIEDISAYFEKHLSLSLHRFVSSAQRTNLTYAVRSGSRDTKERTRELRQILGEYEGPKIVYASTVKTTERLAREFQERGMDAAAYNGRMESEKKMEIQDKFQNGTIDTIVATTAFGMGVDKDNVQLVAHYEMSSTLENYVQEAGRAGRNPEMKAFCVALFHPDDLNTSFQLLQHSKLSFQEINEVWKVIRMANPKSDHRVMSALEIADRCGWTDRESENPNEINTKVRHAVLVLEEQGFLYRRRNRTLVYGTSIGVSSVEEVRRVLGDRVDAAGSPENVAFRIMRHIISKRSTHAPECMLDELLQSLGLTREGAMDGIRLLRAHRLLDSKDDLSARIQRGGNKTSRSILERTKTLQKYLLDFCIKKARAEVGSRLPLNLTQLNAHLEEQSTARASRQDLYIFRGLLRYWAHRDVAEIHLVEAGRQIYHLEFLIPPETVREHLKQSWKTFEDVIAALLNANEKEGLVWFSLNGLVEQVFGAEAVTDTKKQKEVEFALLFLHSIASIVLEKGLLVFYSAMVMDLVPESRNRKCLPEDFELLKEHYAHKAEAVHITGMYAKMMMENPASAQEFLKDYFAEDVETFRTLHLQGDSFSVAVSDDLQKRIENVNEEQAAVIRSRSRHILVAAGPGSGKTHLLVHKAASLLWLEETKPDSLLILTFTRAACGELKRRLIALAGDLARSVTVTTFHSLAFSILGVQGCASIQNRKEKDDLDYAVQEAAELLESGEAEGVGVPGVLLVDEFQDLSQAEYRLLRALYDLGDKQPRVIAVGDDDQGIFEFRGASSKFFRHFAEDFPNTKTYYLTLNYRSLSGIVKANAPLLDLLKDRIKTAAPNRAKTQGTASLEFFEEPDRQKSAFAAAEHLAEQIALWNPEETAAILTRENTEAFLTLAKLEEKKISCRLLKGGNRDKYPLGELREAIWFKDLISKDKRIGERPWTMEEFRNAVNQCRQIHTEETHWEALESLVEDFLATDVDAAAGEVTLGAFLRYLSEISAPDLEKGTGVPVSVGTMHSAKGLEWDHVVLALGDWKPAEQEDFRLLYVACTRAKKTITVFGTERNLPAEWLNSFVHKCLGTPVREPAFIDMETGLGDIYLGKYLPSGNARSDFFVAKVQKILKTLPLQSRLEIVPIEGNSSIDIKLGNLVIACFSKHFKETYLQRLEQNHYSLKEAELAQVCRWWKRETETEVWVPILKLRFEKE